MTPALACFYGGLVENKNFLNQLFLSIVCMAIIPVRWCLFGYSFTFGPGNAVFGSFAMITPALISEAIVGRIKLIPYMILIFLWATFCYDPLARWILSSQGWLNRMGVLEFAGGFVVHVSSVTSDLVAALILGSRAHFDPDVVNAGQTNLSFTILGTGLLWVGWMGFNGGSALIANGKVFFSNLYFN